MPAAALLTQVAQPFGNLRPADRIGHIADAVGDTVFAAEDMQLDDQFHVFSHGIVVVPAGIDHQIFLNRPNAPEIIIFPLNWSNRMRDARKDRSYSSTCMQAIRLFGIR